MKYTLYNIFIYVCLIGYFINFLLILFIFKLFLFKFYLRVFILHVKKDEIFFFIMSDTKDICNTCLKNRFFFLKKKIRYFFKNFVRNFKYHMHICCFSFKFFMKRNYLNQQSFAFILIIQLNLIINREQN